MNYIIPEYWKRKNKNGSIECFSKDYFNSDFTRKLNYGIAEKKILDEIERVLKSNYRSSEKIILDEIERELKPAKEKRILDEIEWELKSNKEKKLLTLIEIELNI
jgi:hypothetical protein